MAAGMATVAEPIGATKVPMSLLEPKAYINYQRIEDNLAVIRERFVFFGMRVEERNAYHVVQAQAPPDAFREDLVRSPR